MNYKEKEYNDYLEAIDEPKRLTREEIKLIYKLKGLLEDYGNTWIPDHFGSLVDEMQDELLDVLKETGSLIKL